MATVMRTATHYLGPHVLYVEDQPVSARVMNALFERLPDCRLVLADCGHAALEKARQLRPALLLLDLRLPDMHGGELLGRLRNLPGCEFAPAVAVTAERDYDFAAAGFGEIWHKPLNLPAVLERVQAYLALAADGCAAAPLPLSTPVLMLQYASRR